MEVRVLAVTLEVTGWEPEPDPDDLIEQAKEQVRSSSYAYPDDARVEDGYVELRYSFPVHDFHVPEDGLIDALNDLDSGDFEFELCRNRKEIDEQSFGEYRVVIYE